MKSDTYPEKVVQVPHTSNNNNIHEDIVPAKTQASPVRGLSLFFPDYLTTYLVPSTCTRSHHKAKRNFRPASSFQGSSPSIVDFLSCRPFCVCDPGLPFCLPYNETTYPARLTSITATTSPQFPSLLQVSPALVDPAPAKPVPYVEPVFLVFSYS